MTAFVAFAAKHWRLFIGAGLLLFIAGLLFTLGQKNDAIEALRNDVAACEARHSITRQSLVTAERAIADQNKAVRALEAEGQARTKAAEDALRRAQEVNREARGAIERLRRSAAEKPAQGDCRPSATLRGLEGEL